MALAHALLVSLSERPGTGIELTRRFDRSIGFFWRATHQQIYRVLRRMQADGWISGGPGGSRSTERSYSVTELGRQVLADWFASPTPAAALRSEVAVKMRGASYGDRERLLTELESLVAEHRTRLAHFEELGRTQFPHSPTLDDHALDTWLVLRGGIRQEQFWVAWLTEFLEAWTGRTEVGRSPGPGTTPNADHPTTQRTS